MAGLSQVPVVIKELSDSETMALALIENLQREDLNAIEEAMGYRDLMENFGLTQEQVSAKVGKSRPVVTNALRLLGLPEEVRGLLSEGKLSAGHARALLSLGEEELIRQAAADTVKKGLSVRQKQQKAAPKPQNAWDQSFFAEVELALSQCLARKVKVEGENGRGRLVIEFYDEDDLRSIASSLEKSGG